MDTTTPESISQPQRIESTIGRTSAAVTISLVALNILVFVAMVARGVGFLDPTAQQVLKWGANYGPLTLNGQWWRLITSLFLHFGIVHILFNMFVLVNIGPFMERLAGRTAFLLLYFVAGIGGGAASLIWHPWLVSGGASGAIFGLYGGLLAYLLRYRSTIPGEILQSLSKGAAVFIGYNLIYGLVKTDVDVSAHLGGLVAGFLAGLFLVQPPAVRNAGRTFGRYVLGGLVGAGMLVATLVALPKPDDLPAELRRFAAVEQKTLALFNQSVENWKAQKISSGQFADILQTQILHRWRAEEISIKSMKRLSGKQMQIATSLTAYMRTREDGWTLLLDGIRSNDLNKIKESGTKSQQADSLAKALGAND